MPPLQPTANSTARLQHANAAGTMAALGKPTRQQFVTGFGAGAVLGLIGTVLVATSAEPDPMYIPIAPNPTYADTTAAYVAAFRQAYDSQMRRDRRDAAIGGGLLGTIVSSVSIYLIVKNNSK